MVTLTDTDLAAYRRDGYLAPLPLLTRDEAATALAGLEDFERDFGERAGFILRHKCHLVLTWADAMVHHPRVLDAVASVLGPNLLCWATSFFIKNARDPAFVSWHQDSEYWGLDQIENTVSVWIALTPSRVENGCLRIVPGTHTAMLEHHKIPDANNMLNHNQHVAVNEADAVDLIMAPGEACLFHTLAVHGSNPNPSDGRRIGFAIRYIKPSCRQLVEEHDSAMLVRGDDTHGHFTLEPRPRTNAAPEALALQQRIFETKDGGLYKARAPDAPG
ncbi:MAG: phytanoyl-CoA dioxygenase family protein [Alphaproteobacteria bacterium]|nr:phytanoyl-CoA dioxygenase family protein [Alphaproteobacteria bacterium]